ncbi:PH domain-containing protein [Flavobacteriaceae bacterium F08102]|nr:PH domain-containing protein [Flavobacteriaceae bacterium F08102]
MKFKSRKDIFFTGMTVGFTLFLFGMLGVGFVNGRLADFYYLPALVILSVIGLLLWLNFGTNYELDSQGLHYKSGPIKGTIAYNRIREIVKGKTMYVGLKPATARKGLIIKYDKFEEIYISPNSNESFLKVLVSYKPDVKITE